MWNLLVVASAIDGGGDRSRTGDLFDFALSEIVRVVDIPGRLWTALVPWSADLAPLVAAAVIDTAPTFDPETSIEGGSRSGLVAYYPPQGAPSEEDFVFYRASHLSLGRQAPLTFAAALQQHPPSHLEERLDLGSEDDDTSRFRELGVQREAESELEPYVPFGLLVQRYFDNMLPDADPSPVRASM